jgi:hypothetical protein
MLKKFNINVFVPKNNSLFVAIISIFLLFSLVLYAYPSTFLFLFNNILGNLLLALSVIGLGFFDIRWAIGLAAIFVILYQATHIAGHKSSKPTTFGQPTVLKEGFDQWSTQLKEDFIKFEDTFNPNYQFDINIIQKQASPEEVEYLLINNKWLWSEDVKAMYKEAIMQNSTTSIDPGIALEVAQTIYNETAIKELMSWNTKEGSFLLTGVTIGHTDGMADNLNNIVRCGTSTESSNGDGSAVMEKIVNTGYDGINGSVVQNITPVSNADIPGLVAGFKFLKNECNPCTALNNPADYSCPFSLNVGDGGGVSAIWNNLWGLTSDSSSSAANKKKQFPLLTELRNELNNAGVILNPIIRSSTSANTSATNSSGSSGSSSSSGSSTSTSASANTTNATGTIIDSASTIAGNAATSADASTGATNISLSDMLSNIESPFLNSNM